MKTGFLSVGGGMVVSKKVSSSGCGVALGQVLFVPHIGLFAYAVGTARHMCNPCLLQTSRDLQH
jgi:hypothetical protein